jgi:anaerobic ribonucleoside-triphosphate reductase
MRLLDLHCNKCGYEDEYLVTSEPVHCKACSNLDLHKMITAPKIYIMRTPGASTSPKRFNNYEARRKEGKRERVTNMLERQGLNDKNNTRFSRK